MTRAKVEKILKENFKVVDNKTFTYIGMIDFELTDKALIVTYYGLETRAYMLKDIKSWVYSISKNGEFVDEWTITLYNGKKMYFENER